MTREHKLALIVGFALVLAVAILISDHFSGASRAEGSGIIADNSGSGLVGPGGRDIEFDLPGAEEMTRGGDERVASSGSDRSVLDSLTSTVRTAIDDLSNGHTPPVAARTEASNTIQMGEPIDRETIPTPGSGGEIDLRDITRHSVATGESLWSIAAKYYGDGHLYKQLAAFNKERVGEGGAVHPGVTILIPAKHALLGTDAPAAPATAPTTTPAAPATVASRTYTVQKGDTLGVIAQRELGTVKRIRDILDLNSDQIENANEIRVGMKLKLPARR